MKQAVVVLAALSLIIVCVQSASDDVTKHVEKVEPVDGDKPEADEKPGDGEILVEDLVSGGHHRQKRREGLRNFLCNRSCGGRGGYCKYQRGYYGSMSCRDNHVCVCD